MNTAVVTGAGRGLGRLIAQRLAARNLFVVCSDIDGDAAEDTASSLGNLGMAMQHDVRDPDAHRAVAKAASARGPLAVWVNNAGILRSATVWDHSDEDVRSQIDVNVTGVVWGARAAIDAMGVAGPGHIINIASMSSIIPTPGIAVYGASKHAVLGFTTSLAGDLRQAGSAIQVSAICPDAIDTDMTRTVVDDEAASLLFTASKMLRADDIADAVVELLDRPRLVISIPPGRAILAHLARPFPSLSLRVIDRLRQVGDRRRRRRGHR